MKISIDVNHWVNVYTEDNEIIICAVGTNLTSMELRFKKEKWPNKKWLKKFTKDLNEEVGRE